MLPKSDSSLFQIQQVQRQSVVTKDNVSVEIDSVIYYHVTNPYLAAFGISMSILHFRQPSVTHEVILQVICVSPLLSEPRLRFVMSWVLATFRVF